MHKVEASNLRREDSTDGYRFPDISILWSRLEGVLGYGIAAIRRREIRDVCNSAEVVTLKLKLTGRRPMRVLCKYGPLVGFPNSHGHRGGVAYEAKVYSRFLEPLDLGTPRFLASGSAADANQAWLILEFLERGTELLFASVSDPGAVIRAAEWIGRFHRDVERMFEDESRAGLLEYDKNYLYGWVERAQIFACQLRRDLPLALFSEAALELLGGLVEPPLTVIHGEYYARNILVTPGTVHPIDWETMALAAGEIDLAMLTEGEGSTEETRMACERAYCAQRWPERGEGAVAPRFRLARLYTHLRWLGQSADYWEQWRINDLYRLANELGF